MFVSKFSMRLGMAKDTTYAMRQKEAVGRHNGCIHTCYKNKGHYKTI